MNANSVDRILDRYEEQFEDSLRRLMTTALANIDEDSTGVPPPTPPGPGLAWVRVDIRDPDILAEFIQDQRERFATWRVTTRQRLLNARHDTTHFNGH